jgi:hypothetical protein
MSRTVERREQRVRAAIRARGLHVTPFGTAGAVQVAGRGVYLIAAAMRHIDERDLNPICATERDAQQQAIDGLALDDDRPLDFRRSG